MAVEKKKTVDYFSHDVRHGKTMYALKKRYGVYGYAFWFMLLELLGDTDGHFIDLNDPASVAFFVDRVNVFYMYPTCTLHVGLRLTEEKQQDTIFEMLDFLADLKAIDKELWGHRIIWSDNFVKRVAPAYRNRRTAIPEKPKAPDKLSDPTCTLHVPYMHKLNETKLKEIPLSTESTTENPSFSVQDLAKLWNDKAPHELSRVNLPFKRQEKRLKPINKAIKRNPDPLWWESVLKRISQSSFLMGKKGEWKASFDFVVDHAEEIIDGKYDNGCAAIDPEFEEKQRAEREDQKAREMREKYKRLPT